MTITEEQAKRYKFPAKAIGYWAVIEETEEQMVLHRLTKNGQLGSDRPNNILKVKKLDIAEIFKPEKSQDEKVLTAKASDGKEVVIVPELFSNRVVIRLIQRSVITYSIVTSVLCGSNSSTITTNPVTNKSS